MIWRCPEGLGALRSMHKGPLIYFKNLPLPALDVGCVNRAEKHQEGTTPNAA